MSINLHRLHVYCVVVEQQSIKRAAELLEVTQPVVSRLVAEVGRHYAADLLVRQGRGVVPTSAGMTVYRYARDVLKATQETDRVVSELVSGERGQVAVAVTTAIGYVFPAVWRRFLLSHPSTQLLLHLVDSPRVLMEVQDGSVDLGLAILAAVPHEVVAHRLGALQMVLVAEPGHPLAGRTITPDLLAGETLLWTNGANIAATLEAYGLHGRCHHVRFGDAETVKRGVELGLGLARLLEAAVERELAAGTLSRVVVTGQEPPADLLLLQRSTPARPPVVNAFAEYLVGQAHELCGRA
jgi:DNA-binding transcriptional LysR family regulator